MNIFAMHLWIYMKIQKVFCVPSLWVGNFVKSDWSRFMYFLPKTVEDITLERWDILQGYLANDKYAIKWGASTE